MLNVWNEVSKRLQQKLKTDADAPYPQLHLTSKDISDSPPKFPCLFVNSLGEPTEGTDLQNNQCYITSTIELQSYSAESPGGSQTEARKIMDAAGDVMLSMGYPRKNSMTKDENDAVSGSGDITNAADIVMTFKRDKDMENHNFLSISKNRWFGNLTKKDGIELWYSQKSRRLRDNSKPDFEYEVGWEPKGVNGFVNMTEDMENPFTMQEIGR